MSGNPDVLEYYKNEQFKKPLWIINLNFCEQANVGLTFSKKELQQFYFAIKTSSTSPVPSGTNSPALKKSTDNVDFLALDFQPDSPSPHHSPSTSSVKSDEEVHYVQVDKEKSQALQNTIQERANMTQSSRPSKDAKL
ncbi:GRB2-associated-binding protein 2 [Cricetulus griseus]|uniref:GRB2-associated-binding protein 2 n=1 Tax=Cricetulus griseus TaxID=10029 RepID=G3IJH9_CRIGR|nr:GRB2-associated-binding protein 2 [Cricetulus griseus]